MIYAKAANLRIEDMTQIFKINSLVLTVYATDANMYINVKGNVTGGLTMASKKRLIEAKNDKEKVLRAICALSNNIYGIEVVNTKDIMARTKLSKYKVIQNIHLLREDGLVKRASMGCPAQVSRGEYEELICDAAPPVNGWALTKKGYASAEYKVAEAEYLNGLAEWANGKQGESIEHEVQ